MLAIFNNSYIKYGFVALMLILGLGFKFYLGSSNPIEVEAEKVIDEVVLAETGVDLSPYLAPAVSAS